MKKIALLAPASSIHTKRWADSLSKFFEVHVLTLHADRIDLTPKAYRVHELPWNAPWGYFLNFNALERILNDLQPALIHIHSASGYGSLSLAISSGPRIVSVWGSDVFEFPHRSPLHKALLKKALQRADVVTSTSHAMANHVCSLYPDLFPPKVIPFGIDIEKFSPQRRVDRGPRDSIVVGTIKALSPVYGIDLLIQAFALVVQKSKELHRPIAKRLELEIVGSGPQEEELKSLVKRLQLEDQVRFIGQIAHERVCQHLQNFDIFVAASRSESFGVAVLEASASGLPVVVTRVGGLPEIVVEDVTGLVAESEDIQGLANAVWELVLNQEKRLQMGTKGLKHVQQNYSWDKCVETMKLLYEDLIRK